MISNSTKTIKSKGEKPITSSMFVCGPRGNVSDTTVTVY